MKTGPFFRVAPLMAVLAMNLIAQSDWNTVKSLPPGSAVQIRIGSRTVSGKVDRVTDDSLAMTAGTGPETFDRQQIVAVSAKGTGHRKRNALIGLAAGAAVGLGVGIAARAKPNQLQFVPNSAIVGGCAAVGSLAGAVVGIVIPTGGWREIYRKL